MALYSKARRFNIARRMLPEEQRSMESIESATGIYKSLIQSLEDDDNDRDVGYKKIATLARHYMVSTDYLLGLSDDYHIQPAAVDELGLTPEAVDRIKNLNRDCIIFNDKNCDDFGDRLNEVQCSGLADVSKFVGRVDAVDILNRLIESRYFHQIISTVAEAIFFEILTPENASLLLGHSDESVIDEFAKKSALQSMLAWEALRAFIKEEAKHGKY